MVYNGKYTNNIIELSMENYSKGMYLLEFKSAQLYKIIKEIKN